MTIPTITRSLAIVATRADIARAAQTLGGPPATSSIYLLLQQRVTPTPHPALLAPAKGPTWELQAAGTHDECMARVVGQAVGLVTGSLRGPSGVTTPEQFIAQQRRVLDAAVAAPALAGLGFRVSMLTHGVADRVHGHREKHPADPVWPRDRLVSLDEGLAAVLAVRFLGTVVAYSGSPFAYLVGGDALLDQFVALPRGIAAA